jgi:sugar porter (SP) family MFS transporter
MAFDIAVSGAVWRPMVRYRAEGQATGQAGRWPAGHALGSPSPGPREAGLHTLAPQEVSLNGEASKSIRIGMFVCLGGFVFGYDAVVISGVTEAVTVRFGLSDWQLGWIVSIPTLTAMFASLAVGVLSDVFGRRPLLMLVTLLYVCSAILSVTANGFADLVIARGIGGLAFSSLVLAPLYLAEISPSSFRGRIVSMNQLAIVLGLSAAYFGNLLIQRLSHVDAGWIVELGIRDHAWRWMFAMELVPASLWLVLVALAVPESPRWLVLRGRLAAARQIMARLYPSERVEALLDRVRASGGATGTGRRIAWTAFLSRPVIAALGVGLIVAVAQQISGVNAIYFYAPVVFQQSGVGVDAAFAQATLLGSTNVVFTLVAMGLIDRLGRKPLLLGGLAGAGMSLAVVAWGFSQAGYVLQADAVAALPEAVRAHELTGLINRDFPNDVTYKAALVDVLGPRLFSAHEAELIGAAISVPASLILAGILCFVASFAVSLGPVMWVVLSEIFPNHIRGACIALLAFANGATSFGVQLAFPVQLVTLGVATTFAFYAVAAFLFFGLVFLFLPETRGRTLEQAG